LITNFAADVKRAVFRSMKSALDEVPGPASDPMPGHAGDAVARGGGDRPPLGRPAPRRTLTAEEMAVVRTQLTTLIRQQPGQSTAQLARAVGIPSAKLRPQLRRLADEGVIRVDEQFSGGLKRHTYRPEAEPWPGHRAEVSAVAAGASA
jgi:hypothetical protein